MGEGNREIWEKRRGSWKNEGKRVRVEEERLEKSGNGEDENWKQEEGRGGDERR